ncbi:MAG: hypothetical protein ABIE70_08105 [bacterium]
MRVWCLTMLVIFLIPASVAHGEWIECDLLQVRSNRAYFSAGCDDYVFPGSRWLCFCAGDTVAAGSIEQSIPGVCFSQPIDTPLIGLRDSSCAFSVESADRLDSADLSAYFTFHQIDSATASFFATDRPESDDSLHPAAIDFSACSFVGTRPAADAMNLSPGCHVGYLEWPQSGVFDRQLSSPAPFVAVMIPNLAKPCHRDGLLTTALYYHLSEHNLWICWDGSEATMAPSLTVFDSTAVRQFPYDPQAGRQLLLMNQPADNTVTVSPAGNELLPMMRFLGDFLARSQIRVKQADQSEADIDLVWLPVDVDNPSRLLEQIRRRLSVNQPHYRNQREALDIVAGYLDSARRMQDQRDHFLHLAEQVLIRDLGVFGLFRPTVYAYTTPELQGLRFDNSGRLDVGNLVCLTLTPAMEEAMR